MRAQPPVVRAVLYVDAGDLNAVQAWHDAAEAALLPLVQPPGAPAVEREIKGFVTAEAGGRARIAPGAWADAMVPGLYQLWTVWGYGDDRPHGPVAQTRLDVFRPGPDEFFWLDLMAELADPGVRPVVCDAMVAVLRAAGDVADPVYGEILVDRIPHGPNTALGLLLRRFPDDSLEEGRRFLRGYEWVTVCPAEIVETLGGAGALRGSGAFAEVIELGAGGVLLRATEDPAAWTDEAVRRVFEAVRPALPPGQPRQPQFETVTNVVMTDARLS
ncbi:MAG TPA: hypothetical protein VF755_10960 [Catenuloplanes sp.]|jgi:hypothetical protein